MGWKAYLTDSGGYQVYSLSANRKIKEEGVSLNPILTVPIIFLRLRRAIEIQRAIGADIIMAFDECTPYPCDYIMQKFYGANASVA